MAAAAQWFGCQPVIQKILVQSPPRVEAVVPLPYPAIATCK